MYQSTEDFNNLERGLAQRGFVGVEGVDSIGNCNKNEKHFILRTDGLVIWTANYVDSHMSNREIEELENMYGGPRNLYSYCWNLENFSFKELDEAMSIVDL